MISKIDVSHSLYEYWRSATGLVSGEYSQSADAMRRAEVNIWFNSVKKDFNIVNHWADCIWALYETSQEFDIDK